MAKILLDCDPGIDDSVAMLLALRSPELQIEAITSVSGNLTADRTALNALKILDLAGVNDVPVSQGALKPLIRKYPKDPFSHGDDGLGNTNLPHPQRKPDGRFAPDVIVETANRLGGELVLVATGPLTNVALAVMKDPSIVGKIEKLIVIGGAFGFNRYAYTNATGDNPVSEWNVYVDPEAARLVFHSGIKIVALGLDVVTHPKINFRPQDLNALEGDGGKVSTYVLALIDHAKRQSFQSYSTLIDSMAIAAAIDGSLIRTQRIHVDVETISELTRGQTIADIRDHFRWEHLPQIEAACEADYDRFLDLLIGRIVTSRNDGQ